ncbi:hypothetical protein Pint_26792 [Pistacia integerrima]|uniref:Uncharacterized protein n=1 Tax=Pistacia integerrima TaxID=434235 RepID=A0ACC0YPI7_9ROSI|nr:hypothetical protein Pint_26792 [Pistacia integerrima]
MVKSSSNFFHFALIFFFFLMFVVHGGKEDIAKELAVGAQNFASNVVGVECGEEGVECKEGKSGAPETEESFLVHEDYIYTNSLP